MKSHSFLKSVVLGAGLVLAADSTISSGSDTSVATDASSAAAASSVSLSSAASEALSPSASEAPSDSVTLAPSDSVTLAPSDSVSAAPSDSVSATPSDSVSAAPSDSVSAAPSDSVSAAPSDSVSGSVPISSDLSSASSNGNATSSGIPNSSQGLWRTKVLPALDCPAPSQVSYEPWVSGLANGADGVVSALGSKDINTVAASVKELICELNNLVDPPTVAIDPSADLAPYGTTSGKIATSLSQLAQNADSLTDGLSARALYTRADVTLQSYAESLASGVISYEKLMSAAIESDSDCDDRLSFSSLVDAMSTALSSLADQFGLELAYPTAPALCSASSCPPCTGASCTPCPTSAPTPTCDICVPVCTASPCVPVCPTCEVATTVVTAFTTYCPEPTTLCTNDVCHTVTAPTTLTITDCPCTIVTVVTPSPSPLAVVTRTAAGPNAGGVGAAPNESVQSANGANSFTANFLLTLAAFFAMV